MKIIYIHQYYRRPEEGGAVRSYHLAKGLVDAGHQVEIISGGSSDSYDQCWIDGVKVHYLPVVYNQKFGFLKRIWSFLQFVNQAKKLIKKLQRPDLFFISSTPLTTGLIGLWGKRKFAVPYVFEVRDLWPKAPIEVGAIKNPLLKIALGRMEKRIYREALNLVALSPGIAEHIRKVCPNRTVALIPNFSDTSRFFPVSKNEATMKKYGISDAMTIAYTGAIGEVNAVDELLNLAELAKKRGKNWQFFIMGEGSKKSALQKQATEKELSSVYFIPFGSKEKVSEVLGISDLAWISFAHLPVLKSNSPNKFFDALAAGKPIIVNHKGWVYDLVITHDLGITCLPDQVEEAFVKLEELETNGKRLAELGTNCRKISEEFFTKEIAVARLLHVLDPSKSSAIAGDEVYILTA